MKRTTFQVDRRSVVLGGTGIAFLSAPALAAAPTQQVWKFDNLRRIGGHHVTVEGAPKLIASPFGEAIAFDGVDDALFVDNHPLAGARAFTFEAFIRPDGGAFEQRWFHLESDEAPPVPPGRGNTRMLFEIRVLNDRWYLDAFITGQGYRQALMVPEKSFPVGSWYHVAQSYDGRTYRSYVDGVLQQEVEMPFVPQGRGRASVGVRLNRVNYFRGAIARARFTHAALPVSQFMSLRRGQS